jgi:pantoate--beta-alanine ligase
LHIIQSIQELRMRLCPLRQAGKQIAIVPTMGYLHEGHLSLCRAARAENDIVVVTIFVNPTQFGPKEDFDRYPRDEKRDAELLERENVDIVFIPPVSDIYPQSHSTAITPPAQSQGWCGASRPGHFQGVCTVVSILFNLVQPDRGYFGEKDAQQLAVIRQMALDLHYPIEIIGCPIVREKDGLAMSSRNVYLSPEERRQSLILSKTLKQGLEKARSGCLNVSDIIKDGEKIIQSITGVQLDYLGIVDQNTFMTPERVSIGDVYLGAILVGKTRLIDNMKFRV